MYFGRAFNKPIIPLVFDGYEIIIASATCTYPIGYLQYHLLQFIKYNCTFARMRFI